MEAVFDLIYNPRYTALLLQAEALGIPAFGGLTMLVSQARRSSELFQGVSLDDSLIDRITATLRRQMSNLILIGMPGCGKSTVAAHLGKLLDREVVDSDDLVEASAHCPIWKIFEQEGEIGFRHRETEVLRQAGRRSGIILATGGGCVERPENLPLLRQNGVICYLRRPLEKLPAAGRPLSQQLGTEALYRRRAPLYEAFSDFSVWNTASPQETAEAVKESFYEICNH